MFTVPEINHSYPESNFTLKVPELQVEHGITALVGPNGSGKSTYARGLAAEKKTNWFYLPQYPEDFLFAENLYEQLGELLDKPIVEADLDRVLSELGFDTGSGVASLPFHFMSNGELRRAALACAFYAEPGAMILDEPGIGMGEKEKMVIIRKLNNLLSVEAKIIVITHDLDLLELAGSVIALDKGRLNFSGSQADYLASSDHHLDDSGVRRHGQN